MLRLGRTTSPRVFHGAVGLPKFGLAMAEVRELDVSEPLSMCPSSLPNGDRHLDSPSLLAAIVKAAPSLRRLSAHGWGKGYLGEAAAISLHKLSVSSPGPVILRSSS